MKNIILTDESHLAQAECEGIEFQRGVPRLVADDAKAETILRHPWFVLAPEPAPAAEPAKALLAIAPPPRDDAASN